MHRALKKRKSFTTVAYVKIATHLLTDICLSLCSRLHLFLYSLLTDSCCYVDVADYQNVRLVCVNDDSLYCEV